MKTIAIAILAVAAMAQRAPQPSPEVLKWQAQAQARERAVNRRADFQLSRATRPAAPIRHPVSKPKTIHRAVSK